MDRPSAHQPRAALGLAVLAACTSYIDVLGPSSSTMDGSGGGDTITGQPSSTTAPTSGDSTDQADSAGGSTCPVKPREGAMLCDAGTCAYPISCNALKLACPDTVSGDYTIDPDGDGSVEPLVVHCETDVDECGYTMVRLEDVALANHQDKYTIKCAAAGMEVIVPRTKAHATAIYVWNGNIVPNLYNVYPMFAGATPIDSWQGICRGAPCTFWMTDNADGNVACTQNLEPNGDNSVNYRIYKNNDGCGVEGGWNDADALVEYAGWVICSTNDC